MLATLNATFVATYFVPLLIASLGNALIIPRPDLGSVARIITACWVVATAYAALNYFTAFAFHHSPDEANPLLVTAVWLAAGLGVIWLPVVLRLKRK